MRFVIAVFVCWLAAATHWIEPARSEPGTSVERYTGIYADFYRSFRNGDAAHDRALVRNSIDAMERQAETLRSTDFVDRIERLSGHTDEALLAIFNEAFVRYLSNGEQADAATSVDERASSLLIAATTSIMDQATASWLQERIDPLNATGVRKGFWLEVVDNFWTLRLAPAPVPAVRPAERQPEVTGEDEKVRQLPSTPRGADLYGGPDRASLLWRALQIQEVRWVSAGTFLLVSFFFALRWPPSGSAIPVLSVPTSRSWSSVRVFDLDPTERAAIRAYPLFVNTRAAFLAVMVTSAALVSFVIAARLGVVPRQILTSFNPGLLILSIPLPIVFFMINARVQQLLQPLSLTVMATIVSLAFVGYIFGIIYWALDGGRRFYTGYDDLYIRLLYACIGAFAIIELLRGYWALAKVNETQLALLGTNSANVFSKESLAYYSGIPYISRYLTSHRRIVLVSFVLSAFVFSLYVGSVLTILLQGGVSVKNPDARLSLLVNAPIWLLGLLVLGNFIQKFARANAWSSLDRLTVTDQRPPILFLRAFKDDQLYVPRARLGFVSRLMALGMLPPSLDTILVEEGVRYGPVVALGNPRDPFPPYGAARGYFQNRDWKDAVSDLAERSQLIVLCAEETESVAWEIDHVIETGHLGKVLFVVPPKYLGPVENAELVRTIIGKLLAKHSHLAPDATLEAGDIIAIATDPNGQLQLIKSGSGSGLAYQLVIRSFIRDRLGKNSRPVDTSALHTAAKSAEVPRTPLTLAPLVTPSPIQVSAFEVTTLTVMLYFFAAIAFGTAARSVIAFIAIFCLSWAVGRAGWLRALLAGFAGMALSFLATQAILPAVPRQSADDAVLHWQSVFLFAGLSAATAAAAVVGGMLGNNRLRKLTLPLIAVPIAGVSTGLGFAVQNWLGGGMFAESLAGGALLIGEAAVYGLIAMGLGLPAFATSGSTPIARPLEGMNLLHASSVRTVKWLLVIAAVTAAAALLDWGALVPDCVNLSEVKCLGWLDTYRHFHSWFASGLASPILIATSGLLAVLIAGMRPRSLLWLLGSAGLMCSFDIIGSHPALFPSMRLVISGIVVVLIGIVLARRDWPEPTVLPKIVYIVGFFGLGVLLLMTLPLPNLLERNVVPLR